MDQIEIKGCVGTSFFSIDKLAKTSDTTKQMFKVVVIIKLPSGLSFKDHHKIATAAIKEMRLEIDRAEKKLDKYFEQQEIHDGN